MLAALTGLGLSTAAGLNAYIPLLVVGLLANFTDQRTAAARSSPGCPTAGCSVIIGVLLLAEVVLDKVPVVDSVNDMIQTVVRPASGGVVFSATQAAAQLDNSTWMTHNPWLSWVLGIGIALAGARDEGDRQAGGQRRPRPGWARPWSARWRTPERSASAWSRSSCRSWSSW